MNMSDCGILRWWDSAATFAGSKVPCTRIYNSIEVKKRQQCLLRRVTHQIYSDLWERFVEDCDTEVSKRNPK